MIAVAMIMAAVAGLTHYNCGMEVPKSITRDGSAVTVREIGFPVAADGWHFSLTVNVGKGGHGIDATVTWPGDPIQIAGKHAALVTADGSIAFTAMSGGPCMFTESMCLTLVNMARQPDNSIKFVLMPSALATDEQAKSRAPFIVVAEGSCKEITR